MAAPTAAPRAKPKATRRNTLSISLTAEDFVELALDLAGQELTPAELAAIKRIDVQLTQRQTRVRVGEEPTEDGPVAEVPGAVDILIEF